MHSSVDIQKIIIMSPMRHIIWMLIKWTNNSQTNSLIKMFCIVFKHSIGLNALDPMGLIGIDVITLFAMVFILVIVLQEIKNPCYVSLTEPEIYLSFIPCKKDLIWKI